MIDPFGSNQIVVNGVPAEAGNALIQDLFEGMLEHYKQYKTDVQLERREMVARSIAKRLCIKYQKALGQDEMRNLVDELFACVSTYKSGDGKPVLKTIYYRA